MIRYSAKRLARSMLTLFNYYNSRILAAAPDAGGRLLPEL